MSTSREVTVWCDPDLRRQLWQSCGDAMTWSWQNADMARQQLVPVHNHFDEGRP